MSSAVISRDMAETVTRVTKEGRKLTYVLTVIQQPERARACGSGAKSSADRRPVDPPPVVELRIFEGEAKNDITFSYNANFFLFATLESARPIIHGRVQQATQQIPVLTGMPVSGMAYLDRPSEAGYFIFPDLSVRHEGKYRLSFNLYEETKESKDEDAEQAPDSHAKATAAPQTPNGSFDWRIEVKSAPFTVFSAKKFPGLAESTILSRTVAEQGCRVRIRRDVRMRRREGKAGGEYDEFEGDEYRRARTETPAESADYSRNRSASNTSIDRPSYDQHRRASGESYPGHQYPPGYSGPTSAPQHPASYLPFGGQSGQQPQFQTPQLAQPAPHVQNQSPYLTAAPQYHQGTQYRPQPSPSSYPYQDRQHYAQYPAPRDGYEGEFRRPSLNYGPTSQPTNSQYATSDQDSNRPQNVYQGYPSRAEPPVLAPLKLNPAPAIEPKYESVSSPVGPLSGSRNVNSLPSPGYQERPNYSSFPSTSTLPDQRVGAKRSFDTVFSGSAYNQPLHNGMRPSSSHAVSSGYNDNEEISLAAFTMQYRRADGTPQNRELPALQ